MYESLPPFFRAVAKSGGLLAYGTALLKGDVSPVYEISAPQRPMNCVEKIIAQNVWCGNDKARGLQSVRPGEQVLCDTGFRGVHEYTAGMVIDLYQQEWGDEPVHNPDLVAAFEDHFVLIDSDTVPLTVKNQRLAEQMQVGASLQRFWDGL